MTQQRFVFEVPEADLQDLRARLGRTRWPIPWPATGWEAGTDAAELHRLVQLWGTTSTGARRKQPSTPCPPTWPPSTGRPSTS